MLVSDLVVARSYGRIVAQVSLNVGRYHMTVNTLAGHEPRARNLSRHDDRAMENSAKNKR